MHSTVSSVATYKFISSVMFDSDPGMAPIKLLSDKDLQCRSESVCGEQKACVVEYHHLQQCDVPMRALNSAIFSTPATR
jgi:hypothetical protein